jgi:hypothetical protein
MKIQVMGFWVVMPCSDLVKYQHFREPCCLHFQVHFTPEIGWSSEALVSYHITTWYHNLKVLEQYLFPLFSVRHEELHNIYSLSSMSGWDKGMHGGNAYKILIGKPQEKRSLCNLGIDGTVILQWNLEK